MVVAVVVRGRLALMGLGQQVVLVAQVNLQVSPGLQLLDAVAQAVVGPVVAVLPVAVAVVLAPRLVQRQQTRQSTRGQALGVLTVVLLAQQGPVHLV